MAASFEALLKQAVAAGQARDYPRAVSVLQRLISQSDDYPLAYLYLGRSLHALGDHEAAVRALTQFSRREPQSGPGHFFLGRSYLALEIPELAVHHLRHAAEASLDYFAAHSLLGLAYLRLNAARQAILCLRRALQLQPDHSPTRNGLLNALLVRGIGLFNRGRYADAADHLREVLSLRSDQVLPHLYLSRIWREAGDLKEALRHLEAAIKLAPDDPALELQRALLLSDAGRTAAAAKELKHAAKRVEELAKLGTLAQLPTAPYQLTRMLAYVMFARKRRREALYYGRRALRENYQDPEIHFLVGETLRHLGQRETAANHYRRVLELDPARPDAYNALLLVLWELHEYQELLRMVLRAARHGSTAEGSYFEALCRHRLQEGPTNVIPLLQQEIRRRGPELELMTALAQEYVSCQLPDNARRWLERALRLQEDHESALRGMIDVSQSRDALPGLRTAFERYLHFHPEGHGIRRKFLLFLLDQQDWQAASEEAAALLPMAPSDDRLRKILAICYRRLERYTEAVILVRGLLREDPNSDPLLRDLVFCLDHTRNRRYAIGLLQKVLKKQPARSQARLSLGELYLKEGRNQDAASCLRAVVADRELSWRAYRSLGTLYEQMGMADFAKRAFDRSRRLRRRARG